MTPLKPIAVVVDEFALRLFPSLDLELGKLGALVMRCFSGLPNPHLLLGLSAYQGVAVIGGRDPGELRERLEAAAASSSVPVVAALPPGAAVTPGLRLAGVVDLLPAAASAAVAAQRIVLMARVPVVRAGARPGGSRGPGAPGPPASPASPRIGQAPGLPSEPSPASDSTGPLRVLGVASSTGGVWVLAELLRLLPREARLAVVVAQHMEAEFVGFFADWLSAASGWPTVTVREPVPIEPGRVYVPMGSHDLWVGASSAAPAPPSSRFVPSADRLLETLGRSYGPRSIGLVLSGMGGDGAGGLAELARAGGRALCQLPSTAVVASMPETALRAVPGARALPLPEMPAAVLEA